MTIYRDYTREELDLQYNVRQRVTDFQDYFDRFDHDGRAARRQHPHLADLPYGEDVLQSLDFFPGANNGRPLLVFIHGGYWRSLDKHQFSHLALPYLEEQLGDGRFNLSREANHPRLELWVAPQRCVDSSTGSVQHMSAELRIDGKVERGCGYFGGSRND